MKKLRLMIHILFKAVLIWRPECQAPTQPGQWFSCQCLPWPLEWEERDSCLLLPCQEWNLRAFKGPSLISVIQEHQWPQ